MSRFPVLADAPRARAAIGGVSGATATSLTASADASIPVRIGLVALSTLALYVLLALGYRALIADGPSSA